MARNPRKMALYEAIAKSRAKLGYDKTLEKLRPQIPTTAPPQVPVSQKLATTPPPVQTSPPIAPKILSTFKTVPAAAKRFFWQDLPKLLFLNRGKIELSIPYQLAVAIALGLILLLLVAFRIGQSVGRHATSQAQPAPQAGVQKQAVPTVFKSTDLIERAAAYNPPAQTSSAKGSNRIVIQIYKVSEHLEPVQDYFARNGIKTQIKNISGWFYLVTEDKYETTEKPGSDGYLALQKIKQLGAGYKAPPGYETFRPRLFSDAYGQKFDD